MIHQGVSIQFGRKDIWRRTGRLLIIYLLHLEYVKIYMQMKDVLCHGPYGTKNVTNVVINS